MKVNYYHQKKRMPVVKIIVFTLASVAGIWGFFWIPFLKISVVEINNPLIRKSQVSLALESIFSGKNSAYAPKNNFFLFSSKEAEKLILDNDLGVAKIKKKFPNKIELEFLEIKPKFLYCFKKCFYADKNGFLYEFAPDFTESPIPLIEAQKEAGLGGYILSSGEAMFLSEFLEKIEKLNLRVEKISSDKDFTLFLKQGWHIILLKNETRPPKEIAQKLKLILEQKIKDSKLEYIDMRFPNKAFYKLRI